MSKRGAGLGVTLLGLVVVLSSGTNLLASETAGANNEGALQIENPVLRGFNPDPSILRVGDDYYIATSTFEWFPGVQIHHSKDLAHWRLLTRPLNRTSQLDMTGVHASCGVWAPCLSYDNGTFYLTYTNVKTDASWFKDTLNYIVTAPSIEGPWSEPVFVHSHGFDPSLFHDEDGRKWVVSMETEYRKGRNKMAGILLQEWSPQEKRVIGPIYKIFKGSQLGKTEGPHLYRRNGWYYLLVAEGGTWLGHAATMARSKTITGPYEVDPAGAFLSSREHPTDPLQRAGHACLVQTQQGDWYIAHLCSRPLPGSGRSILGRETAIQRVHWTEDGWLRTDPLPGRAAVSVPVAGLAPHPWPKKPAREDFDGATLPIDFQTLRIPLGEDTLSLSERPGFLRLKGHESLGSRHHQAVVARRQQAFRFKAATRLEYNPEHFKQGAGLMCMYDHQNLYYLRVTHDETLGKVVDIITVVKGGLDFPLSAPIQIKEPGPVELSVEVDYDRLRFFLSVAGAQPVQVGGVFDASILSDEHSTEGKYTGAFIALSCQDLTGSKKAADFDWFDYVEKN